jgi:hypothetical protein
VISYLDTSAIVPLLVEEPVSQRCRELWAQADRAFSSRLAYAEAAAALGAAHRQGRIDTTALETARTALDEMWEGISPVETVDQIVQRAATLAVNYALRGYDAVHCASAEAILDPDLVACAGDRTLLAAWQGLGLTVRDTTSVT